jgi:hypothetical protein
MSLQGGVLALAAPATGASPSSARLAAPATTPALAAPARIGVAA